MTSKESLDQEEAVVISKEEFIKEYTLNKESKPIINADIGVHGCSICD